ncbi:MAG: modified peptide precursor CbpA [Actinomycetota bacterium]|nr:modified peptide precursor CbpA [Actinomycetota bacterium]MDA8075107.1 modified peptide precursor CbpA [Actinomycetota bacterium]
MREPAVPSSAPTGDAETLVASVAPSLRSEGGDPRRARLARLGVVAYRKACRPDGTGLSHYLLTTAAAPRDDEPQHMEHR